MAAQAMCGQRPRAQMHTAVHCYCAWLGGGAGWTLSALAVPGHANICQAQGHDPRSGMSTAGQKVPMDAGGPMCPCRQPPWTFACLRTTGVQSGYTSVSRFEDTK